MCGVRGAGGAGFGAEMGRNILKERQTWVDVTFSFQWLKKLIWGGDWEEILFLRFYCRKSPVSPVRSANLRT